MKTAAEILDSMAHASGSDEYYDLPPFGKVVLTDGAKYIADAADANWLMVVIASHIPHMMTGERFGVARLTVNKDGSADFLLDDGNNGGNIYATQHIPMTDFPLESIKFYVTFDSTRWTIMLPGEY
jgi:hypothetical protein